MESIFACVLGVALFVLWVNMIIVTVQMAHARGKSPWMWGFLTLFLSFFAMIVLYMAPLVSNKND